MEGVHAPATTFASHAFASHALRAVQTAASKLASRDGRSQPFCSLLQSRLLQAAEHLERAKTSNTGNILDWAPRLLKVLEKICSYPASFSVSNDPADLSQYRILRLLVEGHPSELRLKQLARSKSNKPMKYLWTLEKLLKRNTESPKPEVGPMQKRWDCRPYIRALYSSLSPLCLCSSEEGEQKIRANLQLTSCWSQNEAPDAMNFRLFMLEHPHYAEGTYPPEWQDVQICVPRAMKVKSDHPVADSTFGCRDPKIMCSRSFCNVISERSHAQLAFSISGDDTVVFSEERPRLDDILLTESSISLADLLKFDEIRLQPSQKVLLSYVLAKSVWQFYSSEWMQSPWTKRDVHFMLASRSSTPKVIFINELFLSTDFNNHDYGKQRGLHPFPNILELGIMLLEIGLGIDLEAFKPRYFDRRGQPTINTNYYTARDVYDKAANEQNLYIMHFGGFIKCCIDLHHFAKHSSNIEELRRAFETDVVDVLHAFYKHWHKDADDNKEESICLAKSVAAGDHRGNLLAAPLRATNCDVLMHNGAPLGTLSSDYTVTNRQGPTTSLPHGTTSSMGNVSSEHWFQELGALYDIIRCPPELVPECQPVKIAILDTGVEKSFEERVKAYRDFASLEHTKLQDHTGHGTQAVSLIKRIYPSADIYVGRVFEGRCATDRTADLLAEAIIYAMNEWSAEIIVLASGFDDEHRQLGLAIEKAFNSGVLIFAAASNAGNLRGITFPARNYPDLKLFCMFSTKPNARGTCEFNPSPKPGARYSFAILGEDIKLVHMGTVVSLSGTSYSTMIGAAVAGLLLEFTRHGDVKGLIRNAERLSTVAGMSEVFNKMATPEGNGLDCITPLNILPEHLRGDEVDVNVARVDIRTTIDHALRKSPGT